MKWLTNIYDPRLPDARDNVIVETGQTPDRAWELQRAYLKDKLIGVPKGTGFYTVRELEDMGYVGVYGASE